MKPYDEKEIKSGEILLESIGCIREAKGEIIQGEAHARSMPITDPRKGSTAPYSPYSSVQLTFPFRDRPSDTTDEY